MQSPGTKSTRTSPRTSPGRVAGGGLCATLRSGGWPLLAIVLVALLLRSVALWGARDARLVLDEKNYVTRAHALLDGQGFVGSYQSWLRHPKVPRSKLPQYPGAYQPPLHTAFIAGVMALTDRSVTAVKIVQVGLSTLSLLLLYALGRAWFGRRSGLLAAGIAGAYPNLIAFSHYLWSETLYVFLLLGFLWLSTRDEELPAIPRSLAAGGVLGLLALTRSAIVYFVPVFLVWWMFCHRRTPGPALARAALLVLAAGLVVTPWTIRNTRVHGGFVLIDTNGPYNLWRGNRPDFIESRSDPELDRYDWPFSAVPVDPVGNWWARRMIGELMRDRGLRLHTDLEVMDYARDTARQVILDDPLGFLARVPYKLFDMWNPTSFLIRHFHYGAYGPVSPAWRNGITAVAALAYLGVMLAAGVGLVLGWRRRQVWLVVLFVLFFSAISATAFGATRFRLPSMPLLILLAGYATDRALRPSRSDIP